MRVVALILILKMGGAGPCPSAIQWGGNLVGGSVW